MTLFTGGLLVLASLQVLADEGLALAFADAFLSRLDTLATETDWDLLSDLAILIENTDISSSGNSFLPEGLWHSANRVAGSDDTARLGLGPRDLWRGC